MSNSARSLPAIVKELANLLSTSTDAASFDSSLLQELCNRFQSFVAAAPTSNAKTPRPKSQTVSSMSLWNLVIQINRANFSLLLPSIEAFSSLLNTLKISFFILFDGQNSLKMGPWDMDKLLANSLVKLLDFYLYHLHGASLSTQSSSTALTSGIEDSLLALLKKSVERLSSLKDVDLRRLSLLEIDDPFRDIPWQEIVADTNSDSCNNRKDDNSGMAMIRQVAIENLFKIMLVMEAGPVEDVSAWIMGSSKNPQFIFSVLSKLGTKSISKVEWKLWSIVSDDQNIWTSENLSRLALAAFKKRMGNSISIPKNLKLHCRLIHLGLLSNPHEFLNYVIMEANSVIDSSSIWIFIGLIAILNSDDTTDYCTITNPLQYMSKFEFSIGDLELKALLPHLDSIRQHRLQNLCHSDEGLSLLSAVNPLLAHVLPPKLLISWSSYLLKGLEKNSSTTQSKTLACQTLKNLLTFEIVHDDLKDKLRALLWQSSSLCADYEILNGIEAKYSPVTDVELSVLLHSSRKNLSCEYFRKISNLLWTFLSYSTDFSVQSSLINDWIIVLECQVSIPDDTIFKTLLAAPLAHSCSLQVSLQVFDKIKHDHLQEMLQRRMVALGLTSDDVILSAQLRAFKSFVPKKQMLIDDGPLGAICKLIESLYKSKSCEVDQINEIRKVKELKVRCDFLINELLELLANLLVVNNAPLSTINRISKTFESFPISKCLNFLLNQEDEFKLNEADNGCIPADFKNLKLAKGKDLLKTGYAVLKKSFRDRSFKVYSESTLSTLHLIVYLHRLACVNLCLPEARYFLKQGKLLSEAFTDSEFIKAAIEKANQDFTILTGINLMSAEAVLASPAFSIFSSEGTHLADLQGTRLALKALFRSRGILCNALLPRDSFLKSLKELKDLVFEKLSHFLLEPNSYFLSEWSKLALNVEFFSSTSDGMAKFFEMARNPQRNDGALEDQLKLPPSSIAMLYDQGMEVFWVMIGDGLVLRIPIQLEKYASFQSELESISTRNTATLRSTTHMEAVKDSEKRMQWWRERKSLDHELKRLCDGMSSEFQIPVLKDLLVPSKLNDEFLAKCKQLCEEFQIQLHPKLFSHFSSFGPKPRLIQLEFIASMFKTAANLIDPTSFSDQETLLLDLRKCFSVLPDFQQLQNRDQFPVWNLLVDKELNSIPFESFEPFQTISFKRLPFLLTGGSRPDRLNHLQTQDSSSLTPAFYIVNPSGDLRATQERFESLFRQQPAWKGIIGRPPTSQEFLDALSNGAWSLFIYFGHAGGEIYAPLQELKQNLKNHGSAASALLIGCSSGKIRGNGLFSAESSIFHYLESESPFVLANLWDVTDKDIDTYIHQVLLDSNLLNNESNTKRMDADGLSPKTKVIKMAQRARNSCYLKALNGFAPITYATS